MNAGFKGQTSVIEVSPQLAIERRIILRSSESINTFVTRISFLSASTSIFEVPTLRVLPRSPKCTFTQTVF